MKIRKPIVKGAKRFWKLLGKGGKHREVQVVLDDGTAFNLTEANGGLKVHLADFGSLIVKPVIANVVIISEEPRE